MLAGSQCRANREPGKTCDEASVLSLRALHRFDPAITVMGRTCMEYTNFSGLELLGIGGRRPSRMGLSRRRGAGYPGPGCSLAIPVTFHTGTSNRLPMTATELEETIEVVVTHGAAYWGAASKPEEVRSWLADQAAGNLMIHQWIACIAIELQGGTALGKSYAEVLAKLHCCAGTDTFDEYEGWLKAFLPPYGPGCPLCGAFKDMHGLVRIIREVHLRLFFQYAKHVSWPLKETGPMLAKMDLEDIDRLFTNHGPVELVTSNRGGSWRGNAWVTTMDEIDRLGRIFPSYPDPIASLPTFVVQSLGLAWDHAEKSVRIDYLEQAAVAKPNTVHRSWKTGARHYFLPSNRESDRGRTRPTHRDCAEASMQEFVHLPIGEARFKAYRPEPVEPLTMNWDSVSSDGYARLKHIPVA